MTELGKKLICCGSFCFLLGSTVYSSRKGDFREACASETGDSHSATGCSRWVWVAVKEEMKLRNCVIADNVISDMLWSSETNILFTSSVLENAAWIGISKGQWGNLPVCRQGAQALQNKVFICCIHSFSLWWGRSEEWAVSLTLM